MATLEARRDDLLDQRASLIRELADGAVSQVEIGVIAGISRDRVKQILASGRGSGG